MVTFAPNVQATPDYPFQSDQSRSIQEPRTNVSKELALKGAASALTGGVEVADEFTKQNIHQELHAGIDTVNEAAVARLSAAKVNPSLIEQDETNKVPSGLDGLDHRLETLDMARKGNKYSQTYIDAQRDLVLKEARANHPGYRDYIDDMNAKYTREDPANKLITSLIGDINSFKVASEEHAKKNETEVWSGINKGWDGGREMLQALHSGKLGKDPGPAIADWVFKNSKADYERKKALDQMTIDKFNKERFTVKGEDTATAEASRIARDSLDSIYLQTGVKAMDYPHAVLAGEAERLDPASLEMIGNGVLQKEKMASLAFSKWANTPQPELEGRTIAQVVTPTKLNQIWKEQSQRMHDTAAMYKDKNFGLAYDTHNIDDARSRGVDHYLANSESAEGVYLFQKALGKEGPGFASEFGKSILEDKELLKGVQKLFGADAMRAVTQMPPNPLKATGKPFTMDDGLSGVKRTPGSKDDEVASYVKGQLNLVDKISDPSWPDEPKRKLATFAFDPANSGYLDKFSKESQPEVYQRLYSYGNIKEMHKLGQQDVKLWNNFKTSAYNHFGSTLLHTQLMDLNEIAPNRNLSIGWNNVDHQFRVDKWAKPQGKFSAQENALVDIDYLKAKKSIDAINVGLKSISNISKAEKRDANPDVLQFLLSSGVSKDSMPYGLLEAVRQSGRRPTFKDTE